MKPHVGSKTFASKFMHNRDCFVASILSKANPKIILLHFQYFSSKEMFLIIRNSNEYDKTRIIFVFYQNDFTATMEK